MPLVTAIVDDNVSQPFAFFALFVCPSVNTKVEGFEKTARLLPVAKLLVGVSVAWSAAAIAFNDQVCPLPCLF